MWWYKSSYPLVLSAFRVVTWIPHRWSPASSSLTFQHSSNHHCDVCVCVCVRVFVRVRERPRTCCSASEDAVKVCDEAPAPGDHSRAAWLVPPTHRRSSRISSYCATFAQLRLILLFEFYWSGHETHENWWGMKGAQGNEQSKQIVSKKKFASSQVETFCASMGCFVTVCWVTDK